MAPSHSDEVEFPRGSFERGYYIGEQRAVSRQKLGLPLDRPSTDAEIVEMAIADLRSLRAQMTLAAIQPTLDRVQGLIL